MTVWVLPNSKWVTVTHKVITPPGSLVSYIVFDLFRPGPDEECSIAFPFHTTGKGTKALVPFERFVELPRDVATRFPTKAEYDAAAESISTVLMRLYGAAA